MTRFLTCSNNHTIAVISAADRELLRQRNTTESFIASGGVIFTFVSPDIWEQLAVFSHGIPFHTGTTEDMAVLLAGHEVDSDFFHVPFSNSFEYDPGENGQLERMYRTTLRQAIEGFGLRRDLPLATTRV